MSTDSHTQGMQPQRGNRSIRDEFVSIWPSLPFMAFGLWSAWASLTYSGSLWLSDNETNGEWLSNLYIASTLVFAVVFFIAAARARRGRRVRCSEGKYALVGGAIASLSCVIIIIIGPYYLGSLVNLQPVFWIAALMSGAGTAAIGLRCGVLYGMLPPRRALIYVALSQLVCAFVYFLTLACPDWAPVEHGPALASILVFCLLPIAAAALSSIEPTRASGADPRVLGYESSLRKMPGAFFKFIVFSFALSLIVSVIRSSVVNTHALATTLEGNNVIMLARVAVGLALIVYGVRPQTRGFNLGKICSLVAVFSAILIAALAALGGLKNSLSVAIYASSSVLDMLIWVLLAFIVAQKKLNPIVVFGLGRGAFMLASGLGWLLGTVLSPALAQQDALSTTMYIVMAGVILLLSLGLFSERDFERLFSPVSENDLSLEDLFDIDAHELLTTEGPHSDKRGRFSRAIEKMADSYNLSARESDVLRCLAMGYGSDRMADTLGIKVNTARAHTHNVYVKLDVHSREELMLLVDNVVASL